MTGLTDISVQVTSVGCLTVLDDPSRGRTNVLHAYLQKYASEPRGVEDTMCQSCWVSPLAASSAKSSSAFREQVRTVKANIS